MTDRLHRLVYYSRNLIPGSEADISQEIDAILVTSRRNNKRDDVTGALMFNSGVFAQVLEGSRSAIERVFERIQRDPRHADVMVLAFEPAESRGFPDWSMAFVGRSKTGQNLFARIGNETNFDEKRMAGDRIFSILRDLVLDDERVAAS